jgi:hypothetical protein
MRTFARFVRLLPVALIALLARPAAAQALYDGGSLRQDGGPTKPGDAAKPGEAKPGDKKDDKKKEEKKDEWLAVTNGDVHTVTDGVLRGATVLCKNGKIRKIGYGLEIPKEAATLDASGMTVYPGLIAANSTGILGGEPVELSTDVFSYNMTFALACGWTTVVTGNSAGKLTYGTLDGLLLRNNLWMRMSYASGDERRRLRDELENAREYLRKRRLFEQQKAAGVQGLEEPQPQGVNDAYLKLLSGAVLARFDSNSVEDLRSIAKLVTEFGFKAVVFGAVEGWIAAEDLGRAGVSCVVTPHTSRVRNRELNRPSGATIENAAILYQHGVKVAVIPAGARLSSDGLLDRDLRTPTVEAALAVRGGLPRDAAEAALTINAARILGVDDRVGSIEVGKDADLIVLDGDLLNYESLVYYTVVNGRLVYDKAKESLFRDLKPRPSTYQEPKPPEPPKAEPPKDDKKDEKKEGEAKPADDKKDGAAPKEGEKPKDGDKPKEEPKPEKPKEDPKPGEPPKPKEEPKDPPKPPKPDGGPSRSRGVPRAER